jgi:uncharacterized membrane protein
MKETAYNYHDRENTANSEKEADESIDLINQNVETIAELYARSERRASLHQKAIERVTAFLGRPVFVYFILLFVAVWILINLVIAHSGWRSFDPPPFYWLEGIISLSALLMTTVVLITQNRQKRLTEQRRHLDLQVNLLAEQKVTKLIIMVEELRRDIPSVKNRHDPEVEAMKESVDPHTLLATLNEALNEAVEGAMEEERS